MALKDRIPDILQYIKDNSAFTSHNAVTLDIYEGNLLPYVYNIMQETLSENYFKSIRHRIIPINILRKIIDKLSKVYINDPIRTDAKYQQFVDDYSYWLKLNERMNIADEYANLFKGYALEPYVHDNEPKLRVIPYDRFLVMSEDSVDPLNPTTFIKFMGKINKMDGRGKKSANYYHVYTAEEFLAFDSDGDIVTKDLEGNEGINPIGEIPFIYGNRSRINLIPQIDTDILQLVKLVPVLLSDLAGAIFYQCFSIIYTVDVDSANMTLSPNAKWDLKSDPKSDKTPQVGIVKPEVDTDKVLQFIASTLSFWLETKGVRVGSIGTMDTSSAASGIAKIIDEIDSFEIRKQNIKFFKNEEHELWELLRAMNNYWVKSGQIQYGLIGEDLDVVVEFDEPQPMISEREKIDNVVILLNNGLITKENAIKQIDPDATQEDIDELINVGVLYMESKDGNNESETSSSEDSAGEVQEVQTSGADSEVQ